jgi:exosome complex RNA-binding protein Rrp4
MKEAADNKRSNPTFQIGERVLLKLQPYSQSTVVNMHCPKLAMKYFGPGNVLE